MNFRDHRCYLVHLFRVLAERGATAPSELYDDVADRAGVSADERTVTDSSNSTQHVYRNRIQFARQSLVDAGVLLGSSDEGWRRGIWELSPEGLRLAAKGTGDAALDSLLRERAADGHRQRTEARRASRKLAGLDNDNEYQEALEDEESGAHLVEANLEDRISSLVDEANGSVLEALLDHVRGMDEYAFERLVADVLEKALRAESSEVTPSSHDGGIDGVIRFDALGIRRAVFQAKRYAAGNTVGRHDIDAFVTASRRQQASHALFVTSSSFSRGATETARQEGIRLIDGAALVELMAKNGVGIRRRARFELYALDEAWDALLNEN